MQERVNGYLIEKESTALEHAALHMFANERREQRVGGTCELICSQQIPPANWNSPKELLCKARIVSTSGIYCTL